MIHIPETDAKSIIITIQDPSRIKETNKTIREIYERASRLIIRNLK